MRTAESEQEQTARNDLAEAVKATPKPAGEKTIDKVRKVVESKTASRIGGVLVDMFTASMVVQVYDRLTGERQEKFGNLPVKQMVHKAFQLADRCR